MEEFSKEVPGFKTMRLLNGTGVFVIWTWQWEHGTVTATSEEVTSVYDSVDDSFCDNDLEIVEPEGSPPDVSKDTKPHTVIFKCIGATRDDSYQAALKAARDKMESGEDVPVIMEPEPENIRDPNAIVFKCLLDGHYVRIGYVVREISQEVLQSLEKEVIGVKFKWIKYMSIWTMSGPGFYAGIAVTKKGRWSSKVIKSSSSL